MHGLPVDYTEVHNIWLHSPNPTVFFIIFRFLVIFQYCENVIFKQK